MCLWDNSVRVTVPLIFFLPPQVVVLSEPNRAAGARVAPNTSLAAPTDPTPKKCFVLLSRITDLQESR